MNFDLFYCEKGYPWHYDRPGYRFVRPIGDHWNLVAEDEDNDKLTLFTNYYADLKVDFDKGKRPVSKIKKMWTEFEIFYKALKNKEQNLNP